ncbi:hypothetical protein RSW36_25115 [Escherichia coli]|uniref:hypothetical protein n=1 Tax=Escherichia coli TaxID=562 RepID=UPI0028DF3798|nr:hypothetical protein [Escherichia coli]MDT9046433.1 hypothetical protein [Escherichia coli]
MTTPEIISRAEAKARGLKRFFTGKPCKRGHVAERAVGNKDCAACRREKSSNLRAANPEISRSYGERYRTNNPESERDRKARYRHDNQEKIRDYNCSYRADLRAGFVADTLGLPVSKLTPDLYALKRQQLEIHRLEAELKRELKRLTNEQ